MLNQIKDKIGNLMLKGKTASGRKRGVYNFENARTVGIIVNSDSQKTFEAVREFMKFIKSKNIEVFSIGYVESQEVLDSYSRQIGMDYFTKKECTRMGKPKIQKASEFSEKDFDIMIDLSLSSVVPLKYIATASRAKFKIGRFDEQSNFYDLMIDISKKPELDYFI